MYGLGLLPCMRCNVLFLAGFLALSSSFPEAVLAQSAALASPDEAPILTVRAGVHPGFDRLVFDWPRSVTYQLHREGAVVSLVFSNPAHPRFETTMLSHLSRAKGLSSTVDPDGHLVVHFAVNANAVIKDFFSDKSVVVDIEGEAAQEPMAAAPAEPPLQPVKPPEKMVENGESAKATGSPLPLTGSLAPLAAGAGKTTPVSGSKVPVAPSQKPPGHSVTVTIQESTASAAKQAELSYTDITDIPLLVLSLDPHTPTRAAIYQRAGYGYIVFDRKLTLSAEAMTAGLPTPRLHLEPLNLANASGFRFALLPNLDLRATLNGTIWQIYLSNQVPDIPVSATLVAQPDFALGARFLLPLPDAPEPVHINDPVVGDDLILVPLAQPEAFSVNRHMADFSILPAAQGLVLKPLIDTITVHAVSDGIEISAEGGLHLSPAVDTGAAQQSLQKTHAEAAGKSLFDFALWGGQTSSTFTETRQRLQQIIVDVPESERNRARLELARFYFAHGYGEEASAMLAWIARDVRDLMSHPDFVALSGASKILAYHPEDGLSDLASPLLAGQPEVELWQGVAYAQMRDWKNAEERFFVSESQLDGYPEPFYSRFSILAIEAAFAVGKDREAAGWLDHFVNTPHRDDAKPAIQYLQGVLQAKGGHAEAAEDLWKQVAASPDRLYKVRASLALIDLGVSTGSLTPAQAADRLEALRFAWRGDDLELDILHRLGDFYIQAKNIKAGLNVLSEAVKLYPNSSMTPQIRTEMETIFRDIFLGDLGKNLTPLDALTLYQQYRDLMPSGKDGDAVIRNLSERLVAIDLLDQAANLLEDLAQNRLQGVERAQTATRLAGIRLLDHKPDEALEDLALGENIVLSEDMQGERRLLRARALSELNRDDEAMALLKDVNRESAKVLRADLLMHAKRWDDAAKALLDLIGPAPQPGVLLSHSQAEWLVNCAIAYSLANDQVGLDSLAIDYGAAMAGTPQNDNFRILTEPEKSSQLRDVAAAQAKLGEVDMFQEFLNNYRKSDGAPSIKPVKP